MVVPSAPSGPAPSTFAASARDAKQPGRPSFLLTRGWLKLETKPPGPRVRVRTGLGTITASDAAAVVHAGDGFEVFVETGTARLIDVGKIERTGGEVKGGGFASRSPASPWKPSAAPRPVRRRAAAGFHGSAAFARRPVRFGARRSGRGSRGDFRRGATVADRALSRELPEAVRGEARRPGVPRRDGDQRQSAARMERGGAAAEDRGRRRRRRQTRRSPSASSAGRGKNRPNTADTREADLEIQSRDTGRRRPSPSPGGYRLVPVLQANAREEILQNARLMMEAALVVAQLHQHAGQAAARNAAEVRVPAADGAGVRRDRAVQRPAQEAPGLRLQGSDAQSRPIRATARATGKPTSSTCSASTPTTAEVIGERDTPTGRSLYLARPIQIKNARVPRSATAPSTPRPRR